MKKLILQTIAICAVGLTLPAVAQNDAPDTGGGPPPMGDMPPPPEMGGAMPDEVASSAPNQSVPSVQFVRPGASATTAQVQTQPSTASAAIPTPVGSPAQQAVADSQDQLTLNFDNVPLQMVLNYLSDAAGFIIVMDTEVRGSVSVISSHPMTRDEAVDLLNSVLNQNGYAAIRNGRTLTIMNKDDAKTRDIPVQIGNNPDRIPKNDEIVTQIIPVRYVDASQLVSDLSSFVSPQATIVANQAGNSIVVTDTQENIHHLVEIVSAIDSSAAGETEIRVFPLNYANPNDVATELGEIFPSGSGSGSGLSPIAFRGGGGGGPGGFGGGFGGGGGGGGGFFARMAAAAAANNSGGNRAQKQSQVTAVADSRTQSVIVMASKDLMTEIASMMDQLDVASTRDQQVHVYHVNNADVLQALQVLQGTFPSSSSSRSGSSSSSSSTESSALISRQAGNATTVSQTSESISQGIGGSSGRSGGGGGLP
jgi:general secretion pathway protein D